MRVRKLRFASVDRIRSGFFYYCRQLAFDTSLFGNPFWSFSLAVFLHFVISLRFLGFLH